MSARIPTIVGVVVCFFFLFPFPAFAVSVNIINVPTLLTIDPFTITASISGAAAGTNYIRIDLYKEGTSNYFGETHNGSDWCGSSSGKDYYPITMQSGKFWVGDIQARIGDVSMSEYDGQGTYKIRLRRYTSSGGAGSEDPNNSAVSVVISVPTFTPTPTSTIVPSDTAKPTQVTTATSTNTSTPKITVTMTPAIQPTSFVRVISESRVGEDIASIGSVLGDTDTSLIESTPATNMLVEKRPYIIALVSTAIGLALIAAVSVLKIRYTK